MKRTLDYGRPTKIASIVTDDGGRANLLNDYFSSICDDDNGNLPPIDRVVPDDILTL
jgi:hypothetical protein